MKKLREISAWKWTKAGLGCIVLFSNFSGVLAGEAENSSGETAGEEVEVVVKLKDAERLDTILELQKRVAELEKTERQQKAELAEVTAERNLLRQELFELVNQVESQNAQFRRLELSVADLLAAGKMPGAAAREDSLTEAIGELVKSGRELAVLSVEFCNAVDAIAKSLPEGNLEGVRLRLKIDELQKASRKFNALSEWKIAGLPVERCRLLAVERELNFVVLPVGSIHGVFNGLSFYVPGKNPAAPVRLRVFVTRKSVSAAAVVDGDIATLSPGMEAVTDLQTTNNRE